MSDVTTLYDDLVAVRRTAQAMNEELPQDCRDDLQDVLGRIEGKLRAALLALPEEERFDIMFELDVEYGYCGGAWDELVALTM